MERIINQQHPKQSYTLAGSKLFERGAYYGIRALLVLYITSEAFHMSDIEALNIYGWFTASIVVSNIVGAVLGDSIFGNFKAIIIGGILTMIGAFILCVPELWSIYLGISFIVFGTGLYGPNMIAHYGKNYMNNTALLDAGFTIYYIAISIGAFLSSLTIAAVGELYGWSLGFSIAGVAMLISTTLVYNSTIQPTIINLSPKQKSNSWILLILASFLMPIFWLGYEIFSNHTNSLIYNAIPYLELTSLNINVHWQSFAPLSLVIFSVIAILIWTKISIRPSIKFGVGFILAAGSIFLLSLIPDNDSQPIGIIFIFSIVLMSLAEVVVAPVIFSMIIKHGNAKYFAIISSLIFIPGRMFNSAFGIFYEQITANPIKSLLITAILAGLIGISLFIFSRLYKIKPGL